VNWQRQQRKLLAERRAARQERLYWIVPCGAAFLLYVRSLGFGFVFDDHSLIVENPQVHSWMYLPRLWSADLWSFTGQPATLPLYRPVFALWLLLVHTFGGLAAWFWHFSSVGLHVLATYLVFRLAQLVLGSKTAATGAALLFAVYPIHIEAVSWLAASNELLYTVFVLSSLIAFFRVLQVGPDESYWSRWMWLSVALWTAALFTKESAPPVVAVFFFLAYKKTGASLAWRQRLWFALRGGTPFLGSVVLYLLARFWAIGGLGLSTGSHAWAQVAYSAPSILAFYARKLIWPVGLSSFYINPVFSTPTTTMWITAGLFLVLLGAAVWLSAKYSASIGLASLLLFLPIVPVLVGVRAFADGDLAHDRYMYLPSVGLCLFVGLLIKNLPPLPKTARMGAGVTCGFVLLGLVCLTISQESFYSSDDTYFQRGIAVGPKNVGVIDDLGEFYMSSGRVSEALQEFRQAHELRPRDSETTFQLAVGLFDDKEFAAAEPYLEQVAHGPKLSLIRQEVILLALGETEVRLKNLARAQSVLNELANEDDSYPDLHGTLGAMYELQGRISDAQREFAREAQVSGNPDAIRQAQYLAAVMRGQAAPPPTVQPAGTETR
jgi:protein O-mannosyl-transferase